MRNYAFTSFAGVIICALYLPTLGFDFIGLDDVVIARYFRYYADIRNISHVFAHSVLSAAHIDSAHFRPVLEAYWIVTSHVSRALTQAAHPGVFHAGALGVHLCVCALLWRLLRRIGHEHTSANVLMLLFAVHPAVASSVGWVCGCSESLFAASALLMFERLLSLSSDLPRARDVVVCAAYTFIMLCTKESALLLVPVMVILGPAAVGLSRPRLAHVAALAVPFAAWWIVRSAALQGSAAAQGLSAAELWSGALTAAQGVPMYAATFAAPFSLPGMWPIENLLRPPILLALGALQWMAVTALPARARLAVCWFAACTVLTFIGNKSGTYVLREDHVYTASLGCFLATPTGLWRDRARRVPGFAFVVAIVLVCLGWQTRVHLGMFASAQDYFVRVTERHPSFAEGHVRLGDAYMARQNFPAAQQAYRRSIALAPRTPQAHNNLGVCYLRMGDLDRAHTEFVSETLVQPEWDVAWGNMGMVQMQLGDAPSAEQSLLRAAYLNPDNGQAYQSLASLYAAQSDMPKLEAVLKGLKRMQLVTD